MAATPREVLLEKALFNLLNDMKLRARMRGDVDRDGCVIFDCGNSVLFGAFNALGAEMEGKVRGLPEVADTVLELRQSHSRLREKLERQANASDAMMSLIVDAVAVMECNDPKQHLLPRMKSFLENYLKVV